MALEAVNNYYIVIKYSHHIEPMTPVSHSGVEKNNDDGKRHYFSSSRYDAAAEIVQVVPP